MNPKCNPVTERQPIAQPPPEIKPVKLTEARAHMVEEVEAILKLFDPTTGILLPTEIVSATKAWKSLYGTTSAVSKALNANNELLAFLEMAIGGMPHMGGERQLPAGVATMAKKLELNTVLTQILKPYMEELIKKQNFPFKGRGDAIESFKLNENKEILVVMNDIFQGRDVSTNPRYAVANRILEATKRINEGLGLNPDPYIPVLLSGRKINSFSTEYGKHATDILANLIFHSMKGVVTKRNEADRRVISRFMADALFSISAPHMNDRNIGGRGLFFDGQVFKLKSLMKWIAERPPSDDSIPRGVLEYFNQFKKRTDDIIGDIDLDFNKTIEVDKLSNGNYVKISLMDLVNPDIIEANNKHISVYAGWNEIARVVSLPTNQQGLLKYQFTLRSWDDFEVLERAITKINEKSSNPMEHTELRTQIQYLKELIKLTTDEITDSELAWNQTAKRWFSVGNMLTRIGLLGQVAYSAVTEYGVVAAEFGLSNAVLQTPYFLSRVIGHYTRLFPVEKAIRELQDWTGVGFSTHLGGIGQAIQLEIFEKHLLGKYGNFVDSANDLIISKLYGLGPVTDALIQTYLREYIASYKNVLMGLGKINLGDHKATTLARLEFIKQSGEKHPIFNKKYMGRYMGVWGKDASTNRFAYEMNYEQFLLEHEQIRLHGKLGDVINGVKDVDFNFKDWDPAIREQFTKRIIGHVTNAVMHRDAAQLPLWFSSPMGRSMGTLLTFSVQGLYGKTLYAWELGLTDLTVARGLIVTSLMSWYMTELIGNIRHAGEPMDSDYDPEEYLLTGAISRHPTLSIIPGFANAVAMLIGINDTKILDKYYLFKPGDYAVGGTFGIPIQNYFSNQMKAWSEVGRLVSGELGVTEESTKDATEVTRDVIGAFTNSALLNGILNYTLPRPPR